MKGVLLTECPDATLVDISHHITPYAPLEGSFILSQAARSFPGDTVHLAVVDPGVGGHRRSIFLRAHGAWFVGPDNGLFTPFLDDETEVYRISEDAVARLPRSNTFDGRDLFAPVAARLARGDDPATLGERASQVSRLHIPRPRLEGSTLVGQVLLNDHFGNLITNIRSDDLTPVGADLEVWIGTHRMRTVARTYEDAGLGETIALVGSSGHLEVAVAQGNAAAHLGVGKGERVRVRKRATV
jgi:hypothetical protein